MHGWLFDLYPSAEGLTLWLVDREGVKHVCRAPFTPFFYMRLAGREERRLEGLISSLPCRVELDRLRRKDLYRDEEWEVLRVRVADPLGLSLVVRRLERHFPHFVFFDSDIPLPQMFLYSTGLFPLAYGRYRLDGEGRLADWDLEDSREAVDYTIPPLAVMTLTDRPDVVSPKHRRVHRLEVGYDGRTYDLEGRSPADVLHALNRHLCRCDPDIILTEHGDAVLLPLLARQAREEGIPLMLNRDGGAEYRTTRESSYSAYGQVVHRDGAFELAGRWHLDRANSFMMDEAELEGVAEIARLTQLPVQHQSRTTIGSALSSLQLSWAVRNGYLIPAKKREPEDFKPAATLLAADRGGLIFQPLMGYHEQVAELDFVSMYPTIMVVHNVSPETVNCPCCTNRTVPELGYTVCERRRGIVPATLEAVVRRRALYKREKKRLRKAGDPAWVLYDRRQSALKWMLVTCFGYLGYKNARFGRIEAHETVNAYSREALLKAKEMAEERGYRLLHAMVDCLWLHKAGATEAGYEELAGVISAATGIDLSLEGIYNWILFPPGKADPRAPTANRYVGYYGSGEIKIRGIEMRRRDTPPFIKRMQGEMLRVLEHARGAREVEALVPGMLAAAEEFLGLLRAGRADPLDLVIRCRLSLDPAEYRHRTAGADAIRALEEAGVSLRPGETVEYVLVDASGRKKPLKALPLGLYAFEEGYDIGAYTRLALKAMETLLGPFGWNVDALERRLAEREIPPPAPEPLQLSLFRRVSSSSP